MFISLIFLSGICYAEEKLELKDQKDKESYSFGYQFGQNLKSQGVDLNLDIYTSGIRDALGGKEPRMSQEEIRATIGEIQKRVMASRQKEWKETAEKNLAESKAFLEENKKERGDQDPSQRLAVQSCRRRFWQNTESDGYGYRSLPRNSHQRCRV